MKNVNLLFLLVIFLVISCQKTDHTEPPLPDNLNDLKVSNGFSWSTDKPVSLTITGLPTVIPYVSKLTVSLEDGSELISMSHAMDQNLTLDLKVPSTEKTLRVKFSSTEYLIPINGTIAEFSFIPVLTD
jgi:hypothetical protein